MSVLMSAFDAIASGRATRPKRLKTAGVPRTLSSEQESKAQSGMTLELAKHDLLLPPNLEQVYGSRVLEPHSQRGYEKHYRGLRFFFGLIGDYASLLILRLDSPEHAPAMSVASLCAYLKYKTGAMGSPLMKDDGTPVVDIDGKNVLCDGQWKDPQNMVQFSSAVSAAHKAKGMGQVPYEEQCHGCWKLFAEKGLVTGCRHHAGRGRLSRTGNARFSECFVNCMTRIRKQDLWLYTSSPESMCNPLELVNIRSYLLATNELAGWKVWTMMIFHIRLFLRSDEGVDFNCNQLLPRLTSVDEFGTVSMLAVQVSGKTDKKKWIVLALYRDDQCPELCPIRALLSWIHLSGHSGDGYLFPHDTDTSKCYPPAMFQSKCREVCTKITGRQGPFATHWLRKTGWLLAPWGGASDVDMQQASRHKTLEMAGRYKQNAQSLLEIAKNQRDKNILKYIPKWRAVFVSNLQAAAGVNVDCSDDALPELARKYFKDLVHAGYLNKSDINKPNVVATACLKKTHGWDLKSEIQDLQTQLDGKTCGCSYEVRRLIDLVTKYHTSKRTDVATKPTAVANESMVAAAEHSEDSIGPCCSAITPEPSLFQHIPQLPQKHSGFVEHQTRESTGMNQQIPLLPTLSVTTISSMCSLSKHQLALNVQADSVNKPTRNVHGMTKTLARGGSFDLRAERIALSRLKSTEAKLKTLEVLRDTCSAISSTEFTNGFRAFFCQTLKPALACFHNHCNHSIEEFVRRWGENVVLSRFSTLRCKGGVDCNSH